MASESQCSPNAPFTCLEGPSKFGCHPQENFWPTHGCTEQCQTPGSDPTTSDRGFNIFNKSQQPLYIGVLGHNPLPNGNNGFLLLPGESRLVIPEPSFSGRIWARTGCKRVQMIGGGKPYVGTPTHLLEECVSSNDMDCLLACDTGNCKAANGLAGEFQCTVSGETPASVLEFTFGQGGSSDFYDLSNVDGYNVGMAVNVLDGEPVRGLPPEFNCGNAYCKIHEDSRSWCPAELQVHKESGVYCTSICKAMEMQHIEQVDDEKVYKVVLPGGKEFTGTAREYLKFLRTADDWMDTMSRGGKMKDRLCCQCGGEGLCEKLDTTCTYGCSPYVTNYEDEEYGNRRCPARYEGEEMLESPDWPPSTEGYNFADIYKMKCLQAYSWQFNDSSSTYQCKNGNYEIIFS